MAQTDPSSQPKRELALLLVVLLGTLAWFLGKAFTIDDPVYIVQAKHIAAHPSDPYGAVINWTGTAVPLHKFDKNPPLSAYYLAFAGSLFGWSEVALHAASLLPAALCAVGAYFLARRLTSRPLFVALATLFTPAFLVSATNVMSEIWMLVFWIFATVAWLASFERDRATLRWVSALFIVLAALAKYPAVVLVPLFLVDGLVRERKLARWALPLGLPIVAFAAYDVWSRSTYGIGLLSDAMGFSGSFRAQSSVGSLAQVLVGLAFAGGSLVYAFFAAPLLWGLWIAGIGVVLALLLSPMIDVSDLVAGGASHIEGPGSLLKAEFALFVVGGISALALGAADLVRRRSADSLLLCLWVTGMFVFASNLNWTSNARSILPLAPPVACLLARRMEDRAVFRSKRGGVLTVAILFAGATISVACAHADFSWANQVRAAAESLPLRPSVKGRRAYCIVHWGFQYYLERQGIPSFDLRRDRVAPGDVLLLAENNTNVAQPPGVDLRVVDEVRIGGRLGIHTVAPSVGASFYASVFGPLPFAIGRPAPNGYFVLEVFERTSGDPVPK